MFATFLTNVGEKILTAVQKIINKKTKKSQSAWVFVDFESVKWTSWAL
jgi:hypothetical protein